MKKMITLALAFMMVLSLAACGSKTDPAPSGGPQQPADSNPAEQSVDMTQAMAGIGSADMIYSELDAARKQQLTDELKREGTDVVFQADGSTTFTEEDGTVVKQNADGTWVVADADGGDGQFGGNWPDNEYTKLVPKPDFTLVGAYADSNEFSASFTDATLEQIRDYAEKVKAKGFTIDPEIIDQSFQGVSVFSYAASNANGYHVQIVLSAGESAITITAP